MKINFFTLVLNGMPFIKEHIEIFNKLTVPWHWHIIEGVASLVKDTSWSIQNGGTINDEFHKKGLSIDGTTDYLDSLKEKYSDKITIYRKNNDKFWDGKVEMCNAPLKNINEECLLWQVDVDEIWEPWQIEKLYYMFLLHPEKYSAWFICRYFVGKDLVITSRNTYGNNLNIDWLRVWRFLPGMFWLKHKPPTLIAGYDNKFIDVGKLNPFTHEDTETNGLIFDHFAYVNENQLKFKETYYGYKGAVRFWKELNDVKEFPVYLKDFFPWVNDNAVVDKIYKFISSKNLLIVRTDAIGDNVIFSASLKYFREIFKDYKIHFLIQEHIIELFEKCPYIDELIPFNRNLAINNVNYLNQILNFLKSKNFDIAIYPVYSREMLGDILILESNAKFKIGINGNCERIKESLKQSNDKKYDYLININGKLNELEKNYEIILNLIKLFDSHININSRNFFPDVWIDSDDTKYVKNLIQNINDFIVIAPTALISIRKWDLKKWKKVIDFLKNFSIIITGTKNDVEYIKRLKHMSNHDNLIDLAGKINLRELAYLFSKAKLVISLESAACHIATAVGTPSIVILGGGHFGRFIPYSELQYPVYKKLDCFNCNWICKFDSVKCLDLIEPEDVIEKINERLKSYA